MTSDGNFIGATDEAREASLAEWRRASSTKGADEPSGPTFVELAIADIAKAGAGLVSAIMAHPILVTATVTPAGAGINRVVATKAYAESRG